MGTNALGAWGRGLPSEEDVCQHTRICTHTTLDPPIFVPALHPYPDHACTVAESDGPLPSLLPCCRPVAPCAANRPRLATYGCFRIAARSRPTLRPRPLAADGRAQRHRAEGRWRPCRAGWVR